MRCTGKPATPSGFHFRVQNAADPFSGRISISKVMSGVLKNDATLQEFHARTSERLQAREVMQGKTPTRSRIARRGLAQSRN